MCTVQWYFNVVSTSLSISIASESAHGTENSPGPSVCRSVRNVYCGETANWIWMPFGMVSGVDRSMGVFDFGCNRRRGIRGTAVLGVNLGRSIVG